MCGIDDSLEMFVDGVLYCVEWYGNGQGRWVRNVKGSQALRLVDRTCTVEDRAKLRLVNLHSLFNH